MEVRPEERATAEPAAIKFRRISGDPWFWAALLLGPAVALIGAYVLNDKVTVHFQPERWQQLIWLVVIYPLIEEWLFRGQLQARLRRLPHGSDAFAGISLANVMTSMLFATLHLVTHAPLWALSVIAPSLVFGWFWDRYRSILPGVLLHCSYNLSYFIVFGLPPVSL